MDEEKIESDDKLTERQLLNTRLLIHYMDYEIQEVVPYIESLVYANKAFERHPLFTAIFSYVYRMYQAEGKQRNHIFPLDKQGQGVMLKKLGFHLSNKDDVDQKYKEHTSKLKKEGCEDLASAFSENIKMMRKISQTIKTLDYQTGDNELSPLPDLNEVNNTVIFVENAYAQYNKNRNKSIELNFG